LAEQKRRDALKLGFPSHPRNRVADEIQWIAEHGFQFVDFFLEPENDESRIDAHEIKSHLADSGLGVVGHTAWYLPIGSPMEALRKSAVDIISRQFETFSAIGCRKVTVHANWPPGLFKPEEGIAFQVESLRNLSDAAASFGIHILYEPITTLNDNRENIEKILDLAPHIEFHADIGHLNLHGRNPQEYILAFKDRLGHVHIHDNNGISDLHLPLGVGNIDWDCLIGVLKKVYDGTITLEIFCKDRDYVLMSKEKLEKKWRECE
jgi:sugar phosphate isomerase/epimerase